MGETVTIVGAGIVGICCALSLQERGIRVRLLDRGAPGQETSSGNAGIISPWSIIPQAIPGVWRTIPGLLLGRESPLTVRSSFWPKMIPWGLKFLSKSNERSVRQTSEMMEYLCGPSIDLFRRRLKGTGHEDLVVDSYYIHVFRKGDRPSLDSLEYRMRRERGGELELIGSVELHELEPALSPVFDSAILIKGQARARSPGKIGEVLAKKARVQGAEFINTELHRLERGIDGVWILETGSGSLRADKIVMATGAWSADLLKSLGLKLPLVAERGYHVEFASPMVELRHSVMDVGAKIVASSMSDGLRVAGSAEFADIDAPADPNKRDVMVRQAKAICPGLKVDECHFWLGRRPSFPDSLPAIGEIAGHEGLFAAFGHSHYGLMMAPKTGEVVADAIAGRSQNIDLKRLDPMRFSQ
ncbi:NAD(P)/FAD-dependent oxidoreductase [Notoacmeibacter marinus]|uniref:NAD(P)/FAD-dependent oxidoreductase n=1 Tax=Notoacmeibacter marinus TaxID=1876515 RepID=UPI000DF2C9AC|nr:FAD-binding oxidoreductase [Notoacmeibacter marinus]